MVAVESPLERRVAKAGFLERFADAGSSPLTACADHSRKTETQQSPENEHGNARVG
jgi:hypothetical protein